MTRSFESSLSPRPRSISGLRVVLLEDDPTDARIAREAMEELGAEVHHVECLADLLSELRTTPHDLAVIDLHVPDSQGLMTVRRAVAATKAPVVVLSGIGDHETGRAAIRAGAQDYLTKGPQDPVVLQRTLTFSLERSKLRAQLRHANHRFELALAASRDGLWEWEAEDNVLTVSSRWRHALGLDALTPIRTIQDWSDRVHPDDRPLFERSLSEHVKGVIQIMELDLRIQHEDGTWKWMHCRGLAAQHGNHTRIAGSLTDINELRAATDRLRQAALHDSLTGLPNRAALHERLHKASERSQADGTFFAVLLLDLDRFKQVNDSMGHPVGDGLLQAVSRRLRSALTSKDFVSRIGGDEFVLVSEGLAQEDDALRLARRIHGILKSPIRSRGNELFTAASIGIRVSAGGEDADDLIRDADAAMYRAKHLGRARHVVFDEALRSVAVRELEVENGLRHAITNNDFELYLQPVIDITTQRIRSYEALIRWKQEDGKVLSPGLFMDIAEESGLIVQMGNWVFQEAARLARTLADQHEGNAPDIAINVSPRQLREPDMVDRLIQVMQDHRLPRGCIAVEVTETALIEDPRAAAEQLAALRSHGIRVCLDDFGVGYSSLSWLLDYPFDVLKIDRSFVTELPTCDRRRAIVRAVCDLAKACQVQVVCEGIETEEQAAVFLELGGRFGQGYLYARPAPAKWICEARKDGPNLHIVSG